MAKVVCVLYDDPVDGYPKSYARDDLPKMQEGAARLRPHIAAIYRRAWATPLPDGLGEVRPRPPLEA